MAIQDVGAMKFGMKPLLSPTNLYRTPTACTCYVFAFPKAGPKVVISNSEN
jgi:hypothetical protein